MSADLPLLEVSDLSQNFGGLAALDGVSFKVGRGEIVGLIGPNGSGKTTLLRLIAGIAEPDAGQIALRGGNDALALSQQCHFIADRDAAKLHLTVAENLRFWGDFLGAGNLDQGLESFGLSPLANFQAAVLSAAVAARRADRRPRCPIAHPARGVAGGPSWRRRHRRRRHP